MNTEINVRPYGVAPPDFTLPDTTTLGPVHLQVSDLTQSLEYYHRIIGLRAEETADDTAVLTAHGDDQALVVLRSRRGVSRARRGAFGLYHFALLLPDRAARLAHEVIRHADLDVLCGQVCSKTANVLAYDAQSGKELWRHATGKAIAGERRTRARDDLHAAVESLDEQAGDGTHHTNADGMGEDADHSLVRAVRSGAVRERNDGNPEQPSKRNADRQPC